MPRVRIGRAALPRWIVDSRPGAPVGYHALGMENEVHCLTVLLVLNELNGIHVGSERLSLSNSFHPPYLMAAFVCYHVFEAKHGVNGNLFPLNDGPISPPTGTFLDFDMLVHMSSSKSGSVARFSTGFLPHCCCGDMLDLNSHTIQKYAAAS
ncbi:hypothetical protein STEG23_012061, partial [Scotinomys teguina]